MNDTLIESIEKDQALQFFGGTPSSEDVILPEPEKDKKKDNFFEDSDDFNFSDFLPEDEKKKVEEEAKAKKELDQIPAEEKPEEKSKETSKEPKEIFSFVSKLIEKNKIEGFEDGAPITTLKEVEELIEANMQESHAKGKEQAKTEILESLPPEVQIMVDYASRGGQDIRGLLKALVSSEEVKELSLENAEDHEVIVEKYLESKQVFKTKQEIKEQIQEWKDLGKLEAKAKQFKPELEELSRKETERKIEEHKQYEAMQEEARKQYKNNVFNALKDSDLNGVKLDKRTQDFLYKALTTEHKSAEGLSTNLLGQLLEKYQFIEPNYKLLLEATWLLADPDAYRKKIREEVAQQHDAETVRKLRTSQGLKGGSSQPEEETPKRGGIKRTGFFSIK
jgi:hypothetical protein